MTVATLRTWLAWTALAVYACVGMVPVRGMVLCVDEQGHVALEAATGQGAQASCFDCPTESGVPERCCTETGAEGASCSCTDVLVHSVKTQALRMSGDVRIDAPPVACEVASLDLEFPRFASSLALRARSTLPVLPRVPATLVLRV